MKKMLGAGIKFVIAIIVLAFLGLKSLDFFMFTTPPEQWYYAFLGFGLTGLGVIAYLIIFMWDADTQLKKTIALVMLVVCTIGEVATAGYGIQIETWQKGGFVLAESDVKAMVMVIQLLGFLHALALIGYTAGDQIATAFRDDDGDGIPNFLDKTDNRKQGNHPQPRPQMRPVPMQQTTPKVEESESGNPTQPPQ